MAERPSRAKMCNFLAAEMLAINLEPENPADIREAGRLRQKSQRNLRELGFIASQLGWHADASLDFAWELIQEYQARNADGTGEGASHAR